MIELSRIKPNSKNPRDITPDELAKLRDSINGFEKMMKAKPIVVDENWMCLAGHQRLKALESLDYKSIPDEWVNQITDFTESEKKEFQIRDNVSNGHWTFDTFEDEYWQDEPFEEWLGQDLPEGEQVAPSAEEDNYAPPAEIFTDIVRGDLFEFVKGDLRHRLLCGDSTSVDDVDKLLGGDQPYLMVTDPPYGVEYDPNWRNEAARHSEGMGNRAIGAGAVGKVQNDNNADWSATWAIMPAKVVYVYHAGKYSNVVQDSLLSADYEIANQIIWAKNNFAISRGNYHWKHEPCWYACKKGHTRQWIGGHNQTTVWDIPKPQKSETGHGTQKPIECMARPIRNHDGDVIDPFAGSNTTMVAAHQLNRNCYAIEIDEKYCQVGVDRMLKLDPDIELFLNGESVTERFRDRLEND